MARSHQIRASSAKPSKMSHHRRKKPKPLKHPGGDDVTDGPIIDLNDAAVKRLIKTAKARGYVTLDEINAVLPSDEVTSDQIEDIYAMFSEMGINVVESEEDTEVAAKESRRGRAFDRNRAHEGRGAEDAVRPH